jgi:hypothetical protein
MDSNMDAILAYLAAKITEAINACLQRGMKVPFVVAMVSPNSSVFCLRYDRSDAGDGLTATELAEYNDPAGFALPINIMITDQTGEAALVTIAQDGRATYRAAAATLSAKCWKDGTAEPAFASGVDASYTAGRVGIQTVQEKNFRVYWFAVALNGGTALFPNG